MTFLSWRVIGKAGSGVSAIPVLVAHLNLSSDHDHISIVPRTFWCKSAARGAAWNITVTRLRPGDFLYFAIR